MAGNLVGRGDGERADFPALGNRLVRTGEETGGRFSVVEHALAPKALGAPMHVHTREDEYSFVLSGRIGVQIGEETLEAGPGELVTKPRGVPHAFWNAHDEEARVLELISPAGFERYFADMAPLLLGGGERDFQAIARVQGRYGMEMDPSSIEPLIERYGLRPA